VRFFDTGAQLAIAIGCFSSVAFGQSAEEPLRLEYRASVGCDDEQRFMAAVRARAPRARLARSDEPARVFQIDIEQGAKGTRARLTIREPSGQRTVRDLETKDCREAVDALALIAALAVDPQAVAASTANAQRGTESKSSGAAPPSPGAEPASTAAARSEAPRSELVPPAPTQTTIQTRDVPVATTEAGAIAARSWMWAATVAASGRGGVAPGLLYGGRVGVGLNRIANGGWSPGLRLAGEFATNTGFAVEGGVATFAYAAGSLELCPLRVPASGRFGARPCGTSDLGIVYGRGSEVPNARSASRLWWSVGGLLRLEWLLSARIGVELDIGCTFPVWRDRFRFDPRLIYEVAQASGVAALGVSMHFP